MLARAPQSSVKLKRSKLLRTNSIASSFRSNKKLVVSEKCLSSLASACLRRMNQFNPRFKCILRKIDPVMRTKQRHHLRRESGIYGIQLDNTTRSSENNQDNNESQINLQSTRSLMRSMMIKIQRLKVETKVPKLNGIFLIVLVLFASFGTQELLSSLFIL